MTAKFLMPIVFLTVCCLRSVSFKIEPLDQATQIINVQFSIEKQPGFGTPKQRLLQAIAVSGDDTNSATNEILSILNGLKEKQSLPEIALNIQDQETLARWSRQFKNVYTMEEYLTRLKRFTGSKILKFKGFSSKEKLLKTVQQKGQQLTSISRLTQVGIFVEIIENKYNAIIFAKAIIQDANLIDVNTYTQETAVQSVQKESPVVAISQTKEQQNPSNLRSSQDEEPLTVAPSESETTNVTNPPVIPAQQPAPPSLPIIPPSIITNQLSKPDLKPQIPIIPPNAIQNKQLSISMFSGMILYHDLPSTFSNIQHFLLKGRLLSAPQTDQGAVILILFTPEGAKQAVRFMGWVPKGSTEIQILLEMNKLRQGRYFISAQVSGVFTPPRKIYTVKSGKISANFSQNVPLAPSNLSIAMVGNKLYFEWNQDDTAALRKIIFQQSPNKRKEYILSNFQQIFEVPFKDFYDFNPGTVTVSLSSAYSSSLSEQSQISQYSSATTISFKAIEHHFDETSDRQIQLNSEIPLKIKVGESIVIGGKALNQLENKIYILEPSKTFAFYYFNDQNKFEPIAVGRFFQKRLTFSRQGIYIIEVNNAAGSAVINQPVYVGDGYPLLPDFQDLRGQPKTIQEIAAAQPATLADKRQLMLRLINQKRAEFGVKSVLSDSELDRLAQMHSDDMVSRGFFSHINPSRESPQDRANRLGIMQGVGENIAKNLNVTDGHYRLCRSNAHLVNIVNREWIKVGSGFAIDSDSYWSITQEFAGRDYAKNPLTETQIKVYKDQMISYIKEFYPTVESQNTNLSLGLQQWQNLSLSTQNSQSIMTFLRTKGLRNFVIGNIRVMFRENFVQNMKSSGYLETDKINPKEVGIGMKMDNGWLQIFIAYI